MSFISIKHFVKFTQFKGLQLFLIWQTRSNPWKSTEAQSRANFTKSLSKTLILRLKRTLKKKKLILKTLFYSETFCVFVLLWELATGISHCSHSAPVPLLAFNSLCYRDNRPTILSPFFRKNKLKNITNFFVSNRIINLDFITNCKEKRTIRWHGEWKKGGWSYRSCEKNEWMSSQRRDYSLILKAQSWRDSKVESLNNLATD